MTLSIQNLKPMFGLVALGIVAGLYSLADPSAADTISGGSDGLIWLIAVLFGGLVLKAWLPRFAHLGSFGLILAYLMGSVGLVEITIVVYWLASVCAAGAIVLRYCYSSKTDNHFGITESALVGLAIWLGILGAMLHFPVNYRSYYLGLALLPLLSLGVLPTGTVSVIRTRALALHDWMRSIPFGAWCLGLALIGWTLRWSAFPTMGYDDHAGHLRIWTELLTEKRALFDITNQIWSVAPFASDLLYAGLSLMAGADARSASNLVLAIALLALMIRCLQRLQVPAWVQWLLAVLMASTPMLGNLLLAMQTELLLAVVGVAGLRLVLDAKGNWRGRNVLGVLTCSALCAAIKLPGVVLGATLLLALAIRLWEGRSSAAHSSVYLKWPALGVLLLLAFVAFHSYVFAWLTTGNPLFPLYNAVFKSPFAPPSNFSDPRWVHGFTLRSYVRAFFHTSEFFESGDRTAGWQYLLLLPLSLFAVWRTGAPALLRIALVPLLGFGVIMFAATQYWRYIFPVMPIAGIVMGALYAAKNRLYRTLFVVLAGLCILFNLAEFRRVSWMMSAPAGVAFTQEDKSNLISRYAPAAALTKKINQMAPGSRVLYPEDTPFGAGLHGSPLYVNWYAPTRALRFNSIKSRADIMSFLDHEKVDFAILSLSDSDTFNQPKKLLREHVARYGMALAQEGAFILYSLRDNPTLYREGFNLNAAVMKNADAAKLLIPLAADGLLATAEPKVLAVFPTSRAQQARYQVEFECPTQAGYFIAQINWDKGAPYYRLVACEAGRTSFAEAIPIPLGATQASLYATVRDTEPVTVKEVTVEFN